MLIIFGWEHTKTTNYGSVEQERCPNCRSTTFWELSKISKYFTFFFIPIFSYETYYWYDCPSCDNRIQLDEDTFSQYKEIAEINSDFATNKISKAEQIEQLKDVRRQIDEINAPKVAKSLEESKKWVSKAESKTDSELLKIMNSNKNTYDSAFVIAVEKEMEKRNLKLED